MGIGSVGGFVKAMRRHPGKQHVLTFGPVTNGGVIRALGGPDATGWSRRADTSGLKHALKRHGKGSQGWARGNRFSPADLAKVPQIVSKAHHVEVYPRGGSTRVKYTARIGKRTYTYVETAGGKRRTMTMKTMWWKK